MLLKTPLVCLGRLIRVEDIGGRLLGTFASSVLSLLTLCQEVGPLRGDGVHEVYVLC